MAPTQSQADPVLKPEKIGVWSAELNENAFTFATLDELRRRYPPAPMKKIIGEPYFDPEALRKAIFSFDDVPELAVRRAPLIAWVREFERTVGKLPVKVCQSMEGRAFGILSGGVLYLSPVKFAEFKRVESGGADFWNWLEQTEVYELKNSVIIDV